MMKPTINDYQGNIFVDSEKNQFKAIMCHVAEVKGVSTTYSSFAHAFGKFSSTSKAGQLKIHIDGVDYLGNCLVRTPDNKLTIDGKTLAQIAKENAAESRVGLKV